MLALVINFAISQEEDKKANITKVLEGAKCRRNNTFSQDLGLGSISDEDFYDIESKDFICVYGNFLMGSNTSHVADVYISVNNSGKLEYTKTENVQNPLAVLTEYHVDANVDFDKGITNIGSLLRLTTIGYSVAVIRCADDNPCRIQINNIWPSYKINAEFIFNGAKYKFENGVKSIVSTEKKGSFYVYSKNSESKSGSSSLIVTYGQTITNEKLLYSYKNDKKSDYNSARESIDWAIDYTKELLAKYPSYDPNNLLALLDLMKDEKFFIRHGLRQKP